MSNYPKTVVELTEEERLISDDWYKYWLSIYTDKYSKYASFNHKYVVSDHRVRQLTPTLEIGCGDGEHIKYELSVGSNMHAYTALDIRQNLLDVVAANYPNLDIINADCQEKLPFKSNHFKRIIAMHVLEHLPNLPAAIAEIHRVLSKDDGVFQVVLPCEGGLAYSIARKLSSERMFNKRYSTMRYSKFIQSEHLSSIEEVVCELMKKFDIVSSRYYPFFIPIVNVNLQVGFCLKPKKNADGL